MKTQIIAFTFFALFANGQFIGSLNHHGAGSALKVSPHSSRNVAVSVHPHQLPLPVIMTTKPFKSATENSFYLQSRIAQRPKVKNPVSYETDSTYDQGTNDLKQPSTHHAENAYYFDETEASLQYTKIDPIGFGAEGMVHSATIKEDRSAIDGTLPAGSKIAIKTVLLDQSKKEIEGMARALWLRKEGISEFIPELYGLYGSQCAFAPKGKGRKWNDINQLYVDECAVIEMELIDQSFQDMLYHFPMVIKGNLDAIDGFEFPKVQVPDSVVFETILGEYATQKYLHMSIDDRHFNNYAVKKVPYWRIYHITTEEGTVRTYRLPPGLSARRIDVGDWSSPITSFQNNVATMASIFLKELNLSDVSKLSLEVCKDGSKLKTALSQFKEFETVDNVWKPDDDQSQTYKEFHLEL